MSTNRLAGIFIAITFAIWILIFALSPQPKYQSLTSMTIPGLPISSTLSEEVLEIQPYELEKTNLNIKIEDTISSAKSIVEATDFNLYVYKIGAFGSSQTITKVIQLYSDAGFPAFTEINQSNKSLTTILVGPFVSEEDITKNQKVLNSIAGISQGDLLLIGIIILSGTVALFRGFIQEALSLVLWVFAFLASMFLAEYLDPYISAYIVNPELRRMISLLAIFVIIIFIGGFAIKILRSLIHWSGMGGLDRVLGALFGCVRGLILIVIIYLILPSDIKQSAFISESKGGPILEKFSPEIEIFFRDMISNTNSVMLDSNITPTNKL
jgi:membrane protein required for colicin V production